MLELNGIIYYQNKSSETLQEYLVAVFKCQDARRKILGKLCKQPLSNKLIRCDIIRTLALLNWYFIVYLFIWKTTQMVK